MRLKHVALYSKHWYKRSDDVWADLIKCLEADDYTPQTKYDVLSIIINNVAPLFNKWDIERYTIDLISAISPQNCWKHGYYTKDHTLAVERWPELAYKNYDYYEATLWYFLSKLSNSTITELGGLPKPSKSVLPLKKYDKIAKHEVHI